MVATHLQELQHTQVTTLTGNQGRESQSEYLNNNPHPKTVRLIVNCSYIRDSHPTFLKKFLPFADDHLLYLQGCQLHCHIISMLGPLHI